MLTSKKYENTKFELVLSDDIGIPNHKVCPKCKEKIGEKHKNAFKKEWCPYCGYGLAK